ncbi:MAG: DUF2142 domain-containing protein [Acidobacteria bacterium]|nr:DUF2142 domain-containing protein [Acidobacteriota bacterium]
MSSETKPVSAESRTSASAPIRRALAWLRRVPLVLVAAALLLLSLGAWVFASPVGSSPDDDFHLASIWCADGYRPFACEPGTSATSRMVPSAVTNSMDCYARNPAQSAVCQGPLLNGATVANTPTSRGSFENNYPPVFYAVMGLLVTPNLAVSVILMRFLTVLLLCGISAGLFLALPRNRRAPLIWGWAVTVVPLGMFLLASNNPSSWAIIGVGSGWISLLGFLETRGRQKFVLGALLTVSVVMASGARADAAVYSVIGMGAVAILTFRRQRRYLLDLILPAVLSVVAFLFFITSQQSTVVSSGLTDSTTGPALTTGSPGLLSLVASNLLNLPSLWSGVFGGWGLGWLDTAMPTVVTASGIIAFLVATAVGVGRVWGRKILIVCLLILGIWLIPAFVLIQGQQQVGSYVQPRYILPLMEVLAGVAMLTQPGRGLRWSRFQLAIIGGALALSNAIALHSNIHRYVTGIRHQGWNLDSAGEWWWSVPFSPMFDWIVGSVAFALLLFVLGRAAFGAERERVESLETV